MERYKLDEQALALPPYDLLQAIGAKRGMLISGGEVDTERAAKMLVGEFRASKWGRISLERPPQRAEVTDWEAMMPMRTSSNPALYTFDATKRAEHGNICGVDEAGRGPLCGPVCVAAVILNPDDPIEGVNDSKKLSEKRREALFDEIIARALCYQIVFISHRKLTSATSCGLPWTAWSRRWPVWPLRRTMFW